MGLPLGAARRGMETSDCETTCGTSCDYLDNGLELTGDVGS